MSETLYPLHFTPSETERPWGKENWLLADLGYMDSEIRGGFLQGNTLSELMETWLEKVVGDDTFEYYGLQFPVSVKTIDFDGRTPVFVHPDDTVAEQRYDSLGKVALWQVVSAAPGATLLLGFRRGMSAGEFYEAARNGQLESLMNEVPVRPGEAFVLEPGIVYAFRGKARVIEVSEASSLVFDLSDPEDVVEAFDFVSLEGYRPTPAAEDCETPHFRLRTTLSPEDGDTGFVLHLSPDGSALTLFPAESASKPFPQEGFFILPGRPGSV